jgi:caffeoyl-CoA O-methyltransferase
MGSPADKAFGQAAPALAAWAEQVYAPEDEALREIRERSLAAGLPAIQVGRFDGLHLEVLARACGARRAVEIGTLGGYSGLCLLRGMGATGRLDTFELDQRHAEVARRTFERAGVAAQVRLHLGPAADTLPAIEPDGPFDLIFVDADKVGYPAYLAWAERHLRVGGLLVADNAFAFGHVHAPEAAGPDRAAAEAVATFNERLARGGRFRATILPTGEGLSVGVKIR